MAYKRREQASIIDSTNIRLAAMLQIDTEQGSVTDYGGTVRGALTSVTLKAKLNTYADKLQSYNQLLQQADAAGNDLKASEKDIGSDYTAVLKAAPGKFGENSNEVEMLGGTRKEERKKPKTKPAAK